MANEVSIWNKVMSSAMTVPGVKVDRESFLRKEFSLSLIPQHYSLTLFISA